MKLKGSVGIQTTVVVPPEPIHFPTSHLNSKLSYFDIIFLESYSYIWLEHAE